MPHSCGQYSVAKFLKDKSADAVALYQRFTQLVNQCGPVTVAPAGTRIGFQVRMIFAAVNKLSARGLEAHVVLTRRLSGKRFKRIEKMTSKCYVHHFAVASLSELDDEVACWLREAYELSDALIGKTEPTRAKSKPKPTPARKARTARKTAAVRSPKPR